MTQFAGSRVYVKSKVESRDRVESRAIPFGIELRAVEIESIQKHRPLLRPTSAAWSIRRRRVLEPGKFAQASCLRIHIRKEDLRIRPEDDQPPDDDSDDEGNDISDADITVTAINLLLSILEGLFI